MIEAEQVYAIYKERFGAADSPEYFFAPGRVNLIGEHIDYNGGLVFPAAISLGITAAFQADEGSLLQVYADDFEEQVTIDLKALNAPSGTGKWPLYVTGMLRVVARAGLPLRGGKVVIKSDLPVGSGLSSSAAMECLFGYLMAPDVFDAHRRDLALMAQQAEREEVGVQCGIMDQYAVALGKAGQAILLDCSVPEHEYVPADFGQYTLVIINSNYPRTLADSKYNERKVECDAALAQLQAFDPAPHLAQMHEMSVATLDDDTLYMRATHVVTEQQRVIHAVEALRAGNLEYFGALLWASHRSLDEYYEVAGDALNTIIHYAGKFPGCIGARMTGAGFGGCAIALVEAVKVKRFCDYVGQKYQQQTGRSADFYAAEIVDGVRKL